MRNLLDLGEDALLLPFKVLPHMVTLTSLRKTRAVPCKEHIGVEGVGGCFAFPARDYIPSIILSIFIISHI